MPPTTEPRELSRTRTAIRHVGHPGDSNETNCYITIPTDLRHRMYNRIRSEAKDAVLKEKNGDISSVSRSWIPRTASQ